jgi:hypothetical protein
MSLDTRHDTTRRHCSEQCCECCLSRQRAYPLPVGAVHTSTPRRLLQQLIVLLDSFTFFKLLSCLSHRSFCFWSFVAVVAAHVAFIDGVVLIRTELLFTVPTTRDLGHGSGAMYLRTTPSRVPVADDFTVTHTLANGEPSPPFTPSLSTFERTG